MNIDAEMQGLKVSVKALDEKLDTRLANIEGLLKDTNISIRDISTKLATTAQMSVENRWRLDHMDGILVDVGKQSSKNTDYIQDVKTTFRNIKYLISLLGVTNIVSIVYIIFKSLS